MPIFFRFARSDDFVGGRLAGYSFCLRSDDRFLRALDCVVMILRWLPEERGRLVAGAVFSLAGDVLLKGSSLLPFCLEELWLALKSS